MQEGSRIFRLPSCWQDHAEPAPPLRNEYQGRERPLRAFELCFSAAAQDCMPWHKITHPYNGLCGGFCPKTHVAWPFRLGPPGPARPFPS